MKSGCYETTQQNFPDIPPPQPDKNLRHDIYSKAHETTHKSPLSAKPRGEGNQVLLHNKNRTKQMLRQ